MMKHARLIVAAGVLGACGILLAGDKTGQSTFVPRSFLTDTVYEQALNNYRFKVVDSEALGEMIATMEPEKLAQKPAGQEPYYITFDHSKNSSFYSMQGLFASTGNSNDLARYFLLNNKHTIRFKQSVDADTDVASEHFGLIGKADEPTKGTFDSTLSLRPKRSAYGIIFGVHGDLDNVLDGMFVEARLPVMRVRHELKVQEFNKHALSANAERNTIIQALNDPDWNYGKFNPRKMFKDGVDDLLLRVGYNWSDRSRLYGMIYGDILVPLGDGPTAEFIFEPVIGSVHPGVGLGTTIDWQFHRGSHYKVGLVGDVRYNYRFKAKELRSFDIKSNGVWSRYMRLARRGGISPVDGINFLTRAVDVLPRGEFSLFGAIHYQYSNIHFEGGYNLYARSREAIELHHQWDQADEDVGVYTSTQVGNRTASTIKINQDPTKESNYDAEDTFIRLNEEGLDLRSAAHESVLSHKFFAGASVSHSVFGFNSRFGIGSSYEVADANTALNQWSLWFNSVIQF